MNTARLKSLTLRKVFGVNRTFRDYSERHWTIHPGETLSSPSAHFFADDLTRITNVMEDTSNEREMRRIKGGPSNHGPTVAYQVSAIDLVDGALVKNAMTHPLVRQSRRLLPPDVPEIKGTASLSATLYGSIYFGHWLTDDLTLHLAGESLAPPVMPDRASYRHENGYCSLMGIAENRILSGRFERLIILDDVGQNSFKRRRYQELRSRLRSAVAPSAHRQVYIKRGVKGAKASRAMTNILEIEDYLVAQGFRIVDPDQQSAAEIAEAVAGARLVVGVEGSHLLHAIYSAGDGASVCVLQPPGRFNNVIKDYTDCLGLHYGFTVGTESADGFFVPLDGLKRILDRMSAL